MFSHVNMLKNNLNESISYDSVVSRDNISYVDYAGDIDDYETYIFPVYSFERAFHLYIWKSMVIITSLFNCVTISVLIRREMRNASNIILVVIAVSDSLTGIVTLPTYIMVLQTFEPVEFIYNNISTNSNETTELYFQAPSTNISGSYDGNEAQDPPDGYTLSKDLCNGFMISKYFLSKSFHTVSIFLTLFLAIQRYVSVTFPFKSRLIFDNKRTLVICIVIFVLSPLLHLYHLGRNRAINGNCQWEFSDRGCGEDCVYMWIAFFIRHFLPCLTLVTFSVLFISQLHVGERRLRGTDSNLSQISRRVVENRRISIIVTCIVIVFLIPEIPYGVFLLYNAIDKTVNDGRGIDLKTNRAIQMVYEIALIISFNANFYIYTVFNKRFREELYRIFVKPVRSLAVNQGILSTTRTSSTAHQVSSTKTTMNNSRTMGSSTHLNTDCVSSKDSVKISAMEMKTLEAFAARQRPSEHELKPLE